MGVGEGTDLDNMRGCDWPLPLGLSWPFKLHSSSLDPSDLYSYGQQSTAQDSRGGRLGPVPKDHNCQETRDSLECQKQARGKGAQRKCGVTGAQGQGNGWWWSLPGTRQSLDVSRVKGKAWPHGHTFVVTPRLLQQLLGTVLGNVTRDCFT